MKKSIPFYVLQISMLAALIFVGIQLLAIKNELVGLRTNSKKIQALDAPSVRVVVANAPDVRIER